MGGRRAVRKFFPEWLIISWFCSYKRQRLRLSRLAEPYCIRFWTLHQRETIWHIVNLSLTAGYPQLPLQDVYWMRFSLLQQQYTSIHSAISAWLTFCIWILLCHLYSSQAGKTLNCQKPQRHPAKLEADILSLTKHTAASCHKYNYIFLFK
jgi:hypothetical protein